MDYLTPASTNISEDEYLDAVNEVSEDWIDHLSDAIDEFDWTEEDSNLAF